MLGGHLRPAEHTEKRKTSLFLSCIWILEELATFSKKCSFPLRAVSFQSMLDLNGAGYWMNVFFIMLPQTLNNEVSQTACRGGRGVLTAAPACVHLPGLRHTVINFHMLSAWRPLQLPEASWGPLRCEKCVCGAGWEKCFGGIETLPGFLSSAVHLCRTQMHTTLHDARICQTGWIQICGEGCWCNNRSECWRFEHQEVESGHAKVVLAFQLWLPLTLSGVSATCFVFEPSMVSSSVGLSALGFLLRANNKLLFISLSSSVSSVEWKRLKKSRCLEAVGHLTQTLTQFNSFIFSKHHHKGIVEYLWFMLKMIFEN